MNWISGCWLINKYRFSQIIMKYWFTWIKLGNNDFHDQIAKCRVSTRSEGVGNGLSIRTHSFCAPITWKHVEQLHQRLQRNSGSDYRGFIINKEEGALRITRLSPAPLFPSLRTSRKTSGAAKLLQSSDWQNERQGMQPCGANKE